MLLKLGVLHLGFFQDGDVGVSIFPKPEAILRGNACLGGISQGIRAGEAERRKRAKRKVAHQISAFNQFLELSCCRSTITHLEISRAASIDRN